MGPEMALTLGIETSCDETSVAVVEDGRKVLANVIHSQVDLHKDFGGVVPELAARDHLERLPGLLVSGAHSDLVRMPEHGRFQVIGRTRDDAAGEAFDKAARMLGLGFPGGPALDRLARKGDPKRQPLPKPSLPGLEYSFSGLKTALLYRLRDLGANVTDQDRADLAAAFEQSVVESLLEKLDALLPTRGEVARRAGGAAEVVIAGGVAANSLLRKRAAEVVAGRARLTMPPLELCTDNAAMIAAAGSYGPPGSTDVDPSLSW